MALAPTPGFSLPPRTVFDPSSVFSPTSPNFRLTKLYRPTPIRKHATYAPHPADHTTTIQAPWGPMTMRGAYYLVEDFGPGTTGVYGSAVEAWRKTNRLVEGEMEGKGVWVKVGVVRAIQVADKDNASKARGVNEADSKVNSNDPREAGETAAGMSIDADIADNNEVAAVVTVQKSLLFPVPAPGMLVLTYLDGNVETERIIQVGDWVVKQEDSVQKEVMVLSDWSFRARYTELPEAE